MDKSAFVSAFREAVEEAVRYAEGKIGTILSRNVIVRMYGAGIDGADMECSEFIDRSYISEEYFYPLIDLMVVEVVGDRPVLFARISDHPPAPLQKSWNGLSGPFKQLEAGKIVQR